MFNKLSTSAPVLQKALLLFIFASITACSNKPIMLYDDTQTKLSGTANLKLPMEFDIVYYNGKKQRFMTPYQPLVEYHISTGRQIIGLQYSNSFPNDEHEEEIVKSATVFIQFQALPNKNYITQFDSPKDMQQAKQLANNFKPEIYNGNQIVSEFMDNYAVIQEDDIFSMLNKQKREGEISRELPQEETPLAKLKYWWSKASSKERETFSEWKNRN